MKAETQCEVTTCSNLQSRLDSMTYLLGAVQSLAMQITEEHELSKIEDLAEQINAITTASLVHVSAILQTLEEE